MALVQQSETGYGVMSVHGNCTNHTVKISQYEEKCCIHILTEGKVCE